MLPSIKTLSLIAGIEHARELRAILEVATREELETILEQGTNDIGDNGPYPVTRAWYRQCFNPLQLTTAKLSIADEILGTHGVEYIPAGKGRKSPAVEYCNTGDSYALTLCYISGQGYRVTSWGDIVERGNYE
jgi:hypothetical protein